MIVSGNIHSEANSALPPIRLAGPVAVMRIDGGADLLTEIGLTHGARNLEQADDVRTVVAVINSEVAICCPANLLEPMYRLARQKPLFAFIERALGAAFVCALPARMIVADPAARVGLLAMGVVAPGSQMTVEVSDRLDSLNRELECTIREFRPSITSRTIRRLMYGEVSTGEHLEAIGVAEHVSPLDQLLTMLGGAI